MTSRLRAGVIGAGVFGGHHAAKWASLPGVALAAVLDPHPERAQALAGRHGARAVADAAVLFDAVDIVSIASPPYTHAAGALKALPPGRMARAAWPTPPAWSTPWISSPSARPRTPTAPGRSRPSRRAARSMSRS